MRFFWLALFFVGCGHVIIRDYDNIPTSAINLSNWCDCVEVCLGEDQCGSCFDNYGYQYNIAQCGWSK